MAIRMGYGMVLAVLLALVACSDGGGGGGATDGGEDGESTEGGGDGSGVAQKGPFQPGGTAEAIRLDSDGSRTGDSAGGDIGESGRYDLPSLDWEGATLVVLQGSYYDEIDGSFSSDDRELHAVVASDGAVETNANLYTHLEAHRVRALMEDGDDLTTARDQAADELEDLVGIEAAAGELDLLEAGDSTEEDSANLLLFSAALLQAGHGQAAIDALADDFADNGAIDGEGEDEWQAVQEEAEDDTLLSTARDRLQNQYGEAPPDHGGGGSGLGWRLSPCEALAVTEPRVVCEGETFYGNHREDSDEFIPFIPTRSGHYTVELFRDPDGGDNTGRCSWTVYDDDDTLARDYGDSRHDRSLCGVEDVTEFRLTGGETYYIRPTVHKLEDDGPDARFMLSVVANAEGREFSDEAVELTVGETHDATVGTLINTTNDDESYYRFSAGADGTYTITATGYPSCNPGELHLKLYREVGNNGFSDEVDQASESDACTQTLEVDLEGGTYYLAVENWLDSSSNHTNSRPAPAAVDFKLTVEKQ
ncbi:MAG: hypothetical protein ACLFTX_08210 [Thiohalospira sp.]